ncbi:MAG TPA: DUF5655 domain-containing protein [Chthoniobacterales bacterium]|jgi:hypothetical protein|nr:DUF5655 domain-containing protein [Chthoniobacterales bacterium]
MWHSCGKFSLDDLFARSEPRVLKIFHEYARLVRACGNVRMIPQKSRVVFQARIRFAGATPRRSNLICHFILPRKIDNGRFQKIETFNPNCHVHYLRINDEADLDRDVVNWLKQAYRVGQQEYLA